MKKLVSVLFIVCSSSFLFAQNAPPIEWQKSLGGTGDDESSAVQQTSDGGFIIAGESYSNDNDVSGNHGASDYWIVKTDASGNIAWQKSFGGSKTDVASSVQQTTDHGFIIAGYSKSDDDEVSGHHGTTAYADYWVVKTDSAGTLAWEKSFGGTLDDFASAIHQTSDGGYIVAGYSNSSDSDVTGHHGGALQDDWIVKLDSAGMIQWEKSLGGTVYDAANAIEQTTDGGYIVAGGSASIDGNATGNHGGRDAWILKLDSTGILVWEKNFGGSADDEASSIQQTSDGGFIIGGWSQSNDFDVSGNHGYDDYWVLKIDSSQNLQWQKSLGGTGYDFAYSVEQTTDGGYIVTGFTGSANDDVTGYHGGQFWGDVWVVKLNDTGDLKWEECLGGTNDEVANAIHETSDGGFILTGWSESNDDDLTVNYGSADVWLVQLSTPTTITESNPADHSFFISPNPASASLQINFPAPLQNESILSICNLLGQNIFEEKIPANTTSRNFDFSKWKKGIYLVNIGNENSIAEKQLVIQ